MQRIDITEYHSRLKAQGVSSREHIASKCPMCGTVQSFRSLINAGAGATEADVEKYHSFSCVGRFTGAEGPRKKNDGKPCNWTLGGLFSLHNLEVTDKEGTIHPIFEPASPEEAQELERSMSPSPAVVSVTAEVDHG